MNSIMKLVNKRKSLKRYADHKENLLVNEQNQYDGGDLIEYVYEDSDEEPDFYDSEEEAEFDFEDKDDEDKH